MTWEFTMFRAFYAATLSFALFAAACGEDSGTYEIDGDELESYEAALMIGSTGGLAYTCTNDIGSDPTCTCHGYVDCRRLVNSGECRDAEGATVLTCDLTGVDCSCHWQSAGRSSGGLASFSTGGVLRAR